MLGKDDKALQEEYKNVIEKYGIGSYLSYQEWRTNPNYDWNLNEKEYEEYHNYVMKEFGWDCYNDPSGMYNSIADFNKRIDEPLTTIKSILIKDDRAKGGYYWSELDDEERAEVINYTPIRGTDENPITMRLIINTLQKDKHYSRQDVREDNHNFLEGYVWINPYLMVLCYGS